MGMCAHAAQTHPLHLAYAGVWYQHAVSTSYYLGTASGLDHGCGLPSRGVRRSRLWVTTSTCQFTVLTNLRTYAKETQHKCLFNQHFDTH